MTSEPFLPFDDEVEAASQESIEAKPLILRRAQDERNQTQDDPELADRSTSLIVDPELAERVEESKGEPLQDAASRAFAIDPSENVVLEASAGTGKTQVLVNRYLNLMRAGVEPEHILAITFTRKAASEMRQRIVEQLKGASRTSRLDAARWRDLRGRLGDIAVSTIDAFCLALLREYPLEADVDPAFELADDTEIPRLTAVSLDRSLGLCRALAREDHDVALVFAQLGERRLRAGLALLLDRRLIAPRVLRLYLASGPRDLTSAVACRNAAGRLVDLFKSVPGGLAAFLRNGPQRQPPYSMLAADIAALVEGDGGAATDIAPFVEGDGGGAREFAKFAEQAAFRAFVDRLRGYFLTQDGKPRGDRFAGTGFKAIDCDSDAAWKRHREAAATLAPAVAEIIRGFRRDLNVVLSRGIWRMFAITVSQYQRTLEAHARLDFAGVLERAVDLLKQMDEFARSRYRLEARYHHVLVDEFQDTSRVQWELVEQLIRSWGEGLGAASDALAPSIFIVGDRKQSIYGFRDAETGLLDEAAQLVAGLRGYSARRAISVSFRSAPPLLAFVNDLFDAIQHDAGDAEGRRDAFRYDEEDRFPLMDARPNADATDSEGVALSLEPESLSPEPGAQIAAPGARDPEPVLGLVATTTVAATADLAAAEIARLIGHATVRDRATGVRRMARPADIAILFRSRESHRPFEAALERLGVPTYVYKGLGFFDADEIQDTVSVLRYLADPASDLRAAAFLRSRLIRLSDKAVMMLGPRLAAAIVGPASVETPGFLPDEDRIVLTHTRAAVARWLSLVDRITPAELVDLVLRESAYYYEIRGRRRLQARENLKKLRGLIRRIQNRGYATLARIAEHLEQLAIGDESNAAIDAVDAVSLMTVHAAKGLEFPVVFLVNLGRGTGSVRPPIRVTTSSSGSPAVSVADFQSEADEETQRREREDTKRLLYVALTRARDRVYLAATVPNGVCRMGRGSLGEVLPLSVTDLFVQTAAGTAADGEISWAGGGRVHRFRTIGVGSI